jgi:hypothetical protein
MLPYIAYMDPMGNFRKLPDKTTTENSPDLGDYHGRSRARLRPRPLAVSGALLCGTSMALQESRPWGGMKTWENHWFLQGKHGNIWENMGNMGKYGKIIDSGAECVNITPSSLWFFWYL